MPIFRLFLVLAFCAGPVFAQVSILGDEHMETRAPFLAVRQDAMTSGPSLFADRATHGLFAPRATPAVGWSGTEPPRITQPLRGTAVERLRGLIGQAESHHQGYDAVQYGARVRPGKPPTQMTLHEIFAWIAATPNQPHAIGRYQFIPSTLRRLVEVTGTPEGATFNPEVQDRLADVLLEDAGMTEMSEGRMSRHTFMNNLARIWAGLPNSSGRSHYHGYAGNKATMTWTHFDAEMAQIFPS